MLEREKVIKGLECCTSEQGCKGCPYNQSENGHVCTFNCLHDAVVLLKEQEAVECINDHGVLLCGRCKNIIGYDDGYGRSYKSKFCCECGRSVK